jgi:hypothetical protein
MFYRESAPAPEISHLVLSFWKFLARGENSEPLVHEVFPKASFRLFTKEIKISILIGF